MKNVLPEIDILPVHEVNLEVIGKVVKYKPFNVEQEKALLMALESENINDIINNYKAVVDTVVMDEIDWNNLSMVDFINLIIHLRSKSKGENLEFEKKCNECGKSFDIILPINEVLKYENVDVKKVVLKIHDKLTLELSPIKYFYLYDFDKLKNEIDVFIHTAVHSISKIIYNGSIYKVGLENMDEIKEKIVSKLSLSILADIFKKCKEMISLHMVFKFKCTHCEKEEVLNFDDYLKLLK